MGQKSEMKLDIHLWSFAIPCAVYEVSPDKFLSAGKAWKRSKTDTITLSVSAGKCGPAVSTILSAIMYSVIVKKWFPIVPK